MQTVVNLYKNPGFSANHNYVLDFPSVSAQTQYFDTCDLTITEANFDKYNTSLTLELDYLEAKTYSYLRFNWNNKYFYYFINDVTVVTANDDTTVVRFSISEDVWQTYLFDFDLKTSNVQRAHVDRWGNGSLPIRITPFNESINCYNNVISEKNITNNPDYALVVISWATSTGDDVDNLKYICFPVSTANNPGVFLLHDSKRMYPTIEDINAGIIATKLGTVPENIQSMVIVPFSNINIVKSGDYVRLYYPDSASHELRVTNVGDVADDMVGICYYTIRRNYLLNNATINIDLDVRPTKPTNGANYSTSYEPALFMSPFMRRIVTNGSGMSILEIPDNVTYKKPTTDISVSLLPNVSNTSLMLEVNNENDGTAIDQKVGLMGGSTNCISESLDVISDAWLTYKLTEREGDRDILKWQCINASVSTMSSMGIGGGLVGARTNNLSGIAKGTGLGVAGGLVSSMSTWASTFAQQDAKEQNIRNKPSTMLISGNGASAIQYDMLVNRFMLCKCDDINYNYYADVFHKYGYAINAPLDINLKSRKYFNYIKTNGAIVEGALNNSIKGELISIFDNGTTIWHMDYATIGDYSKENIERSLI